MPRASQLLHPELTPAPLRQAATVLLVRDTPDGWEVLMTKRSSRASFAADLYVFPGGAVDAADQAIQQQQLFRHQPLQEGEPLTWALAALRESFEEVGVLLATRADGQCHRVNLRVRQHCDSLLDQESQTDTEQQCGKQPFQQARR